MPRERSRADLSCLLGCRSWVKQVDKGCWIAIGVDERSFGEYAKWNLAGDGKILIATVFRSPLLYLDLLILDPYPYARPRNLLSQLVTLLAFSLLRPRDKRVYAPKIKYHQAVDQQKRASRLHQHGSHHVRDHSTGNMANVNEGGYEAKGDGQYGFERDREEQNAAIEDPFADAAPPPAISNGFFSWFSPVLHVHEEAMLEQIGKSTRTFTGTSGQR